MEKIIKNSQDETLDYSFSPALQAGLHPKWLVILAHGVTGNKDRPLVTAVAKALNDIGFDTLRFSFSGNGESEGDFRAATITKEKGDLRAVLDAANENYAHLCCLGHSMGGAVSTLVTASDPRVDALISLAGMIDTKNFAETEFGDVTPDQGNMWDDSDCPLSNEYMADLCQTIGSVLPEEEKIDVPWLLLHGTADDTVNPQDSESVANLGKNNVTRHRIDGADHSFNEAEHSAATTEIITTWLSGIAQS